MHQRHLVAIGQHAWTTCIKRDMLRRLQLAWKPSIFFQAYAASADLRDTNVKSVRKLTTRLAGWIGLAGRGCLWAHQYVCGWTSG